MGDGSRIVCGDVMAALRELADNQVAKSRNRRAANDSRMRDGQVFKLNPLGCLPTDIWSLPSASSSVRHYATFPEALVRPIIEACSEPGDLVLDPFVGSGTVCATAAALGRRWLGIELNPEYAAMAMAAVEERKATNKVHG